ncbi:MAG TPA: hypothetical protein VFU72_00315, partial [Nitrolancea sp.]|nr:hypothetical protein [Nitrolancea sp.]
REIPRSRCSIEEARDDPAGSDVPALVCRVDILGSEDFFEEALDEGLVLVLRRVIELIFLEPSAGMRERPRIVLRRERRGQSPPALL